MNLREIILFSLIGAMFVVLRKPFASFVAQYYVKSFFKKSNIERQQKAIELAYLFFGLLSLCAALWGGFHYITKY